jgi:hypothetical protein
LSSGTRRRQTSTNSSTKLPTYLERVGVDVVGEGAEQEAQKARASSSPLPRRHRPAARSTRPDPPREIERRSHRPPDAWSMVEKTTSPSQNLEPIY